MRLNIRNLNIGFVLVILLNIIGLYGNAQNCNKKLAQAQKEYETGRFEEVHPLLDSCFNNNEYSKKEKIQVYKLFILTAIFEDNKSVAEQYMLALLKLNPEYELVDDDTPEFKYLYDNFITDSKWSVGVTAGITLSTISSTTQYGVHNTENSNPKYSFQVPGLDFGIRGHRFLFNKAELDFALNRTSYIYNYEEQIYTHSILKAQEEATYINMPISFNYDVYKSRFFRPYIKAGIMLSHRVKSFLTLERIYTDNSHVDITGSREKITDNRRPVSVYATIGAGVKFKIKYAYIYFESSFCKGLLSYSNSETVYNNYDIIYKYFYIDNKVFLDYINLNLGYRYLFYKPRKRPSLE